MFIFFRVPLVSAVLSVPDVVVPFGEEPGRHEAVDVGYQQPDKTALPEGARCARRLHGPRVSDA